MKVTAVLFDMGGTLLSYENREKIGHAFLTAMSDLGLDVANPQLAEARKQASTEVERRFSAISSFVHRDLFRERVIRTAELMGVTASKEVLERFDTNQREAVIEHLCPMAGVHEMLGELRSRGIYLAVVSNADDDFLEPVLARNGLTDLLDDWTSSEEAKSCKPDNLIFEYSLAKAKHVASEVLFVGDSAQHDIAGARNAGMRGVLISEPNVVAPLSVGLTAVEPDWHIRHLMELVGIVDSLNR